MKRVRISTSEKASCIIFLKQYLANILTCSRGLLAIPIFLNIISSRFDLSIILYLLALATDVLDGYVARSTNSCSSKGAFFDASMDFLLVIAGVSGYVLLGEINAWLLAFLLLMFGHFVFGFGGEIVYDPFWKLFGIIMLGSLPLIMLGSDLTLFLVNYFTLYLGLCSFVGRVIYLGTNFSIETHVIGVLNERDR